MKPLYLTIEGINSFTSPVAVDFERLGQNGIFCICGPTGSGKTTILDCVILALYAPANHTRGTLKDYINTGCDKGKITLDFTAEGTRYRVYRELRRNASSAAQFINLDTGEVLADKADTATEAVKKMLKLDKDDFTKVVVLEQGKYAEFMTMTKKNRHETVAKLFNLERFSTLKERVAEAKRRYEDELAQINAALAQYEDATESALAARKRERKALQKSWQEAREKENAAAAVVQAGEQNRNVARLRAQATCDLQEAEAQLRQAGEDEKRMAYAEKELAVQAENIEIARKENERTQAVLQLADACENDGKELEQKEAQRIALREKYSAYNAEVAANDALCEKLFARENELRAMIAKEEALRDAARERYERLRRENAAAVVRLSLSVGDTCPVCGGAYRANADCEKSASEKELAAQKAAWENSEKAAAAHTEELQKNLQARFAAEAKKAEATVKRDGVTDEGKRIAEEVKATREKIAARLGGKSPAEARATAEESAKTFALVCQKWEQARTMLQQSKAELAARISAAREKAASAQNTLAALPDAPFDEQAFAAAQDAVQACKEQTGALAEKVGGIAAQIEQLEAQLQKKKALTEKRRESSAALENILRLFACTNKDRLLSFVAEQYMQSFTETAGETLFSLTGGKYTLIYEEDEFWVRDFLADNARRKVKTLSGGETFLASMSIAMAISRALATQNYEFFFLDEGFGTLHERAVETVANALIELSRSTTVGIVTHRTELADRIASRLTVSPATETCGSTVEYTEA